MTTYTGEKQFLRRSVLSAAAMLGLLSFVATPRVFAHDDDYGRCQRRVAKADHNVHEAIEHHGWNSRQADHARHELNEARERCWNNHHRWWDEDGHRWHTDRDWDDHDHDHDRH